MIKDTSFCLLILCSLFSLALCSYSIHNNFLECLNNQTSSSSDISTIVYSKANTNYNSVLNAYIRNLRFRYSSSPKPQLIITPNNPSQVSSAVICARNLGLHIKIRSGGHDYEGLSYVSDDNFVILDMNNLRLIEVDPTSATAYVQAGSTAGEFYHKIIEKSNNTLGFPAGVCMTLGIGGHLSGAGYSNMMRKYGVSADHIIDATVVDAMGRILNRSSMGEDLFWAIRGGGGASFAVVVSFTVMLVPVPETVTLFDVKRVDNLTDLVYKYQFLMKDVDHNLFMRLLLKPGNVTFKGLYLGNAKTLISLLDKEYPELGATNVDCLEMSWGESLLKWANLDNKQNSFLNRSYSTDSYFKRKSDYVQNPIPKAGLELLWKKLVEVGKVVMVFNSYGGRMNEIPATDLPFPYRKGNLFKIQYQINWKENGKVADDDNVGLIRELYKFMTPYVSQNPRSAFFPYRDIDIGVNHNGSYNEGEVYGRKYFGVNFHRLVKVKGLVDPDNFFRNEQSIPLLKS